MRLKLNLALELLRPSVPSTEVTTYEAITLRLLATWWVGETDSSPISWSFPVLVGALCSQSPLVTISFEGLIERNPQRAGEHTASNYIWETPEELRGYRRKHQLIVLSPLPHYPCDTTLKENQNTDTDRGVRHSVSANSSQGRW
jgi:hypothetical protein